MQHLAGDLPELTGCVLACDCEMDMVCEGDALAGLVFEFGWPPAHPGRRAPGAGRGGRAPPYSGRSHPVLVARGGSGCILLALPSALLRELLLPHGGGLGEPTAVHVLYTMAAQSWTPLGRASSPNAGFPPAEAAGSHFERSLARADEPLPTEQPPLMDLDLQFAADTMASNYGSLRELRQGAVRALRELKSRWARVSTRLRHLQPDAIRTATQQRDLGLLGLLVVLLSWGDGTMLLGFVQGLPTLGRRSIWDLPTATGPAHHTGGCLL